MPYNVVTRPLVAGRWSLFVRPFMMFLVVTANCFFRPFLVIRVPLGNFRGARFGLYFEVPTWHVNGLYEIGDVALIVSRAVFRRDGRALIRPVSDCFAVDVLFLLFRCLAVFQVLDRRAVCDDGNRFGGFRVNLFIVSARVMRFTFCSLARCRVGDFAVIFRMRPVTCVAAIAVCEGFLSFGGVLSGRQGRFFQGVVQAVIVEAADSDGQRFVHVVMDRCRRVHAYF